MVLSPISEPLVPSPPVPPSNDAYAVSDVVVKRVPITNAVSDTVKSLLLNVLINFIIYLLKLAVSNGDRAVFWGGVAV